MSNNGMGATENIRYGWLAAIGSVALLAILILAQSMANQHIPQLGNLPVALAGISSVAILALFISAMILLAEKLTRQIMRQIKVVKSGKYAK